MWLTTQNGELKNLDFTRHIQVVTASAPRQAGREELKMGFAVNSYDEAGDTCTLFYSDEKGQCERVLDGIRTHIAHGTHHIDLRRIDNGVTKTNSPSPYLSGLASALAHRQEFDPTAPDTIVLSATPIFPEEHRDIAAEAAETMLRR